MANPTDYDSGGGSSSTITDTVMSNIKEVYDIEGMSGHISAFNSLLTTYKDETQKIDDSVIGTICNDGFKGDYAQRLFDTYEDLVGNFTGFANNYEEWNDMVAVENATYGNYYEESANILDGTTGGSTTTGNGYVKASDNRSVDGTHEGFTYTEL